MIYNHIKSINFTKTYMFGDRLANERKRLGLTQQDLATELNVSRAAIAMCETGKNNMDNRSLAILAQKLNLILNSSPTPVVTHGSSKRWLT